MTSWGRGLVPLATIFFGGVGLFKHRKKGRRER